MDSLGNDILVHIARFLDAVEVCFLFSCCKRFRNDEKLWQRLFKGGRKAFLEYYEYDPREELLVPLHVLNFPPFYGGSDIPMPVGELHGNGGVGKSALLIQAHQSHFLEHEYVNETDSYRFARMLTEIPVVFELWDYSGMDYSCHDPKVELIRARKKNVSTAIIFNVVDR